MQTECNINVKGEQKNAIKFHKFPRRATERQCVLGKVPALNRKLDGVYEFSHGRENKSQRTWLNKVKRR